MPARFSPALATHSPMTSISLAHTRAQSTRLLARLIVREVYAPPLERVRIVHPRPQPNPIREPTGKTPSLLVSRRIANHEAAFRLRKRRRRMRERRFFGPMLFASARAERRLGRGFQKHISEIRIPWRVQGGAEGGWIQKVFQNIKKIVLNK